MVAQNVMVTDESTFLKVLSIVEFSLTSFCLVQYYNTPMVLQGTAVFCVQLCFYPPFYGLRLKG